MTSQDARQTAPASVTPYGERMGKPEGFEFVQRGADVVIWHHGKVATTLRGAKAQAFLADAERGDVQLLMARVTGNYRRGNERMSRQHPCNAGR